VGVLVVVDGVGGAVRAAWAGGEGGVGVLGTAVRVAWVIVAAAVMLRLLAVVEG
jgi:hypothetical protein